MEVFSPARVAQVAAKYGLIAGQSLGLLTGWDLSDAKQQEEVWKIVERDEPEVIIGSPPCTLFSTLQNINWARYSGDDAWRQTFYEELTKAKRHVAFCCRLYRYQLSRDKYFIHEHPWSAASWKEWEVETLLRDERVVAVKSDLCRFGMMTAGDDGRRAYVRKRTGFMTNSQCIAKELEGECPGGHTHTRNWLEAVRKTARSTLLSCVKLYVEALPSRKRRT